MHDVLIFSTILLFVGIILMLYKRLFIYGFIAAIFSLSFGFLLFGIEASVKSSEEPVKDFEYRKTKTSLFIDVHSPIQKTFIITKIADYISMNDSTKIILIHYYNSYNFEIYNSPSVKLINK